MIELYFDGLCRPKNGPDALACYAWILQNDAGDIISQGAGEAGRGLGWTGQRAEYAALIAGLHAVLELGLAENVVTVFGDSQVTIYQMTGQYSVNVEHLQRLNVDAWDLAGKIKNVKFEWVPREQNARADALANTAYKKALAA